MEKSSRNLILLTTVTLCIAMVWLAYGVRHTVLDVVRDWRRGPIPQAISRVDFERMIPRVESAQAEDVGLPTNEETADDTAVTATPETQPQPNPDQDSINADDSPQPEPQQDSDLPEVMSAPELPSATSPLRPSPAAPLPENINLLIPFTTQAPNANWDELHEETCEEVSAMMVKAYYDGEEQITPEEAESRIMDAVTYEAETFGYHASTEAEKVAQMMRELLDLPNARAIPVTGMEEVRAFVAAGHPVIVPAYGKALGNPNFRNGGPLYHMLVVKGYSGERIITNDPGTRRGADYVYDEEVLWNALHDWNNGDVPNGEKIIIVAG